uniref:DUF58 domain-containing protein n=1 Tax=Ignisphaera aggregans TaxID=334771 RepID=A0A7J2U393_9CREN
MISPTSRFSAYMAVTALVISVALLLDPGALPVATTLLALEVAMSFHLWLSMGAVERLGVEVSIDASTDREPVTIRIRLVNRGFYPILLAEYSLGYEPILRLEKGSKAGILMAPSRGAAELVFVFGARVGIHKVGPLTLAVRDFLGLFKSQPIVVWRGSSFRVIPSTEAAVLKRLHLYTRSSGLVRSRRPGEGIEFYDVRDYRSGDELRRVVWRIYASRQKLAVWEAERESYQAIVYIVNSSRDMWTGAPKATPIEHSARVIASIARYAASRGYLQAAVVVNECGVWVSGAPAYGRQGLARVLETLASVGICMAGERVDWSKTLANMIPLLPRERIFIFIFTKTTPNTEQLLDLATKLSTLGHRVYIVAPLTATYDISHRLPQKLTEVYRAKQLEVATEELKGVELLRKAGMKVIAVSPQLVAQRIVQAIELSS